MADTHVPYFLISKSELEDADNCLLSSFRGSVGKEKGAGDELMVHIGLCISSPTVFPLHYRHRSSKLLSCLSRIWLYRFVFIGNVKDKGVLT